MATEEPTVAVEPAPETATVEPTEENPTTKTGGKAKKPKEPKPKKSAARSRPTHPSYEEVWFQYPI